VAAVVAWLVAAPIGGASASEPLTVYASPAAINVFIGDDKAEIEVRVGRVAAPGLGSFQFDALYDPSLVTLEATVGVFPRSTGNTVTCTTTRPDSDRLRFACSASNSPPSGPVGDGVLAVLSVEPVATLAIRAASNNDLLTSIELTSAAVWDVNGNLVPLVQTAGAAAAVRSLEADVNTDCVVDQMDVDLVSSRYPSSRYSVGYGVLYDLEPATADGDIDLSDVQFVFARNGSTCENPIPAQPAPPAQLLSDTDADGVPDVVDNCPGVPNSDQANADGLMGNGSVASGDATVPWGDPAGDACSTDRDGDGLANVYDTNPLGTGDICSAFAGASDGHSNPGGGDITNDDDRDGEPASPMGNDSADDGPSWDTDNDGALDGVECDLGTDLRNRTSRPSWEACGGSTDADGDGLPAASEVCKWGTSDSTIDSDGDGLGDCQEAADIDGDGIITFPGDVVVRAGVFFGGPGGDSVFDLDGDGLVTFPGDVSRPAEYFFGVAGCM
jgi:hypothetical protein